MDFDWKSLVKNVAPTLGAALGGPFAGMAVKVLAESLLGDPAASEESVAEAVMSASPDKLIELRKVDNDFKLNMKKIGVDIFKLEVEDRTSARELAKFNIAPHMWLSAVYTIGYFVMLYMFMTGNATVDPTLTDEFGVVLGVMTAAQIKILDFWFGSSFGSRVKD